MAMETIAIIGGTGDLGQGLAARFSDAGFPVVIGSRDGAKGEQAALALNSARGSQSISGTDNRSAAAQGDVVVITVPFAHQKDTLLAIRDCVTGKIVVDATVCLQPPKVGTVQLPPGGSAGMIAQETLGEDVQVVSAFQNVPAAELKSDHPITCHILVTGNSKAAREKVVELIGAIGARGFSAGPIANSIAAEALTSVLITINRQFKTHAGIQLTNVD